MTQALTLVESATLGLRPGSGAGYELSIRGPRHQRYRLEKSGDLQQWSPLTSLIITREDGTGSLPFVPQAGDLGQFFRAPGQ